MTQVPRGRRLSRKEFLEVVGAGAAGSVALFAAAGCTSGPAEVVGSAQEGAQAPPSKKKSGADIKGATDALVTFITTASLRTVQENVNDSVTLYQKAGYHVTEHHPRYRKKIAALT